MTLLYFQSSRFREMPLANTFDRSDWWYNQQQQCLYCCRRAYSIHRRSSWDAYAPDTSLQNCRKAQRCDQFFLRMGDESEVQVDLLQQQQWRTDNRGEEEQRPPCVRSRYVEFSISNLAQRPARQPPVSKGNSKTHLVAPARFASAIGLREHTWASIARASARGVCLQNFEGEKEKRRVGVHILAFS